MKHRRILLLATLEALAVELAAPGHHHSKVGAVVVKRRADHGQPTPRLVVLTEAARRYRVRRPAGPENSSGAANA